jgi:hypothetical protein
MSSEWMKVMLEEISRKKAESEQARAEQARRVEEGRREEEGRGKRPVVPARSDVDRARG